MREKQRAARRRIGVLGTLVRDRIWPADGPREAPTEQWGGIAYSLAAMTAACPPEWEVVPLLAIGRDREVEARAFLERLPNLSHDLPLLLEAEQCRVELRYHDRAERSESFHGTPPRWSASELLPRFDGLDALYLNFISGYELDLGLARTLRSELPIPIPIYADLHSLCLGPVGGSGPRRLRLLPEWRRWLSCFDLVQLNEQELRQLRTDTESPEPGPHELLESGPRLVAITRGGAGATIAWKYAGERAGPPHEAAPGEVRAGTIRTASTRPQLSDWFRLGAAPAGEVITRSVPLLRPELVGDPTGCGDIWGSVFFVRLLSGHDPVHAALAAHEAAAARLTVARVEELSGPIRAALHPLSGAPDSAPVHP